MGGKKPSLPDFGLNHRPRKRESTFREEKGEKTSFLLFNAASGREEKELDSTPRKGEKGGKADTAVRCFFFSFSSCPRW